MKTTGQFTLSLHEDGKHATIEFKLPDDVPQGILDWFRFTYSNDLLWRHHAGNVGAAGGVEFFSTVRMSTYRKFLHKINDDTYIIKEDAC